MPDRLWMSAHFIFMQERSVWINAGDKISKLYFYSDHGVLHGILHDNLYRCPRSRRPYIFGFLTAIKEMWIEYVIVFILIFFVITKIAQKLAFRLFTPGEDKPIFVTIAIQSFTVMCIVPAITLIVTFIHNGFTINWFTQWITTAVTCFPMAYCLQVFFIGPFVRFLFRKIFAK